MIWPLAAARAGGGAPAVGSQLSTLATCRFRVRTTVEAFDQLSCSRSANKALRPLTFGPLRLAQVSYCNLLSRCLYPYKSDMAINSKTVSLHSKHTCTTLFHKLFRIAETCCDQKVPFLCMENLWHCQAS